MYRVLVEKEGLAPQDAAERIYKDLVGIWEKDTIRRLLPASAEAKGNKAEESISTANDIAIIGVQLTAKC